MVEDVEERFHRLLGSCPFLHIINNQHINGLVEVDEVIHRVLTTGISKLNLEQTSTHIKHALLWIHLFHTYAYGIDQMGLTTS